MKICVIIFLFALPMTGFSQTKLTGHLELRGTVDVLGNIYLKRPREQNRFCCQTLHLLVQF